MRNPVEIEDIEDLRRRQGIEDVELWEEIRGLAVGALVKLTLLTGPTLSSGETLRVRITRIRGGAFRGKLAESPTCPGLANLRTGSPLAFTTAHIHSIPKGRSCHEL
jgi:hypothetical protein